MSKDSFSKKRSKILMEKEIAVAKDILKVLYEATELKNSGDEQGYKDLIDSTIHKLKKSIAEHEPLAAKSEDSIEIDRSNIPAPGGILAKNDKVTLKMADTVEESLYIGVSYDCSSEQYFYKDEQYKADLWNDFLAEHAITVSIYDTATNDYIGYCMIKDMRKEDWEIAIEENHAYRNQGYGYNVLSILISKLRELTGHRFFRARVDIDNTASQRLFKKLGAYPDGISEFALHGDELKIFRKENMGSIDDNIKALAEEFCTDPEDLIGMVLEYRIDVGE